MKREELNNILENHIKWLKNDGGERANLRGADLRGSNLRGSNLRGADLIGADLRDADLRDADLRDADLTGANLVDANLRCANLRCANLRCANLANVDLVDANLRGANLRGENLANADLRDANLAGTLFPDTDIVFTLHYTIHIREEYIKIGCEKHTFEKWMGFSDSEINRMDDGALKWWKDNKEIIRIKYNQLLEKKA